MDTHNHAWAHMQMLMCAHSDIKLMWTDRVTGDIVQKYGSQFMACVYLKPNKSIKLCSFIFQNQIGERNIAALYFILCSVCTVVGRSYDKSLLGCLSAEKYECVSVVGPFVSFTNLMTNLSVHHKLNE